MANPQLEDGYTPIANDIMDALARTRIPGECMQVLIVILRKTYGWGRQTDLIPISQIHEATGIKKPHVIRARKKLEAMNIIVAQYGNAVAQKGKSVAKYGNAITEYRFNKDFETWRLLPKKVTLPKKVINVAQKGNGPLPKMVLSKTSIKTKSKIYNPSENSITLTKLFLSTMSEEHQENFKDQLKWNKAFDDLLRHYDFDKLKDLIAHYRSKQSFWHDKFLTPLKLLRQDKYGMKFIDRFLEEMKSKPTNGNGGRPGVYVNPTIEEYKRGMEEEDV